MVSGNHYLPTLNAAVDMVTSIEQALDENKIPAGLFIDLRKAFDAVNYSICCVNWNLLVLEVLFYSGFGVI